jgi:AraC family transcriptional regulator, positive regulator of tynA and feaB
MSEREALMATTVANGEQRFTTDDPSAAWEDMLKAAYGSVELLERPKAPFRADLRTLSIANLMMIEASSNAKTARRTTRNIATDSDEYFMLILVKEGKLTITQFDREWCLVPGTFGLFHLSSPSFYCHQEKTEVIDLKIPASALRSYVRDPFRYVAIARSAEKGVGRVTSDFFYSLSEQAAHMPAWALHACAGQMMTVVATAIECEDNDLPLLNPTIRAAIFKRAAAFIEINVGDPLLDSKVVARAMGVSLRYLQKIFQEQSTSIGEFIRHRRLERCREDLLIAQDAHNKVKEIAFRAGFRNASHFSALFKRRYGISPDGLRRRTMNEK